MYKEVLSYPQNTLSFGSFGFRQELSYGENGSCQVNTSLDLVIGVCQNKRQESNI